MKYNLSFPIYSPVQKINLPTPIKKCYAIRINQVTFKFNDFNKKVLLLSIQGLDNNKYFDGVKTENYTFIFFNDGSKSTINYINNVTCYDASFTHRNIEYLDIITKIDDNFDGLISTENVLYISIDFFSE